VTEEEEGPAQDPIVFDSSTADLEAPVEAASPAGPEAWTHNNAYIQYQIGVGTQTPGIIRDIDVRKNRDYLTSIRVMNANTGAKSSVEVFVTTGSYKGLSVKQYGSSFVGTYMGKNIRDWSVIRSESSSTGLIVAAGGYRPLVFGTWDTERMRIEPSGRVGIGTDSPYRTLHVVGDRIRLQNGTKIVDLRADGAAVDLQTETNSLFIRSTGSGHHLYLNTFSNDGTVYVGHGGTAMDVNGVMLFGGQAPIIMRRYENVGNNATFSTGISGTDYNCTIGGWSGRWDINENGAGDNFLWTQVLSGTWYVRTNFYSHNDHENLDVDLLCFRKELVWYIGDKTLFDPD
jgi:hypothetical protein